LQIKFTGRIYLPCIRVCPVKVGRMVDDHFQLAGPADDIFEWLFKFLWGKTDPVPFTTQGIGAGGFYMGLEARCF